MTRLLLIHGIGDHPRDWWEAHALLLPDNVQANVQGFWYEDILEESKWGSRGEALASKNWLPLASTLLTAATGGPIGFLAGVLLRTIGGRAADWVGDYGFDIPAYLKDELVCEQVRERLANTIRAINEPVVILAHSLGAAVADETLRQYDLPNVKRLITMGCPQGKGIARNLLEKRSGKPPQVEWINLHGTKDFVAGWPPLSTALKHRSFANVDNRKVINGHKLHGYLNHLNDTLMY